jgi:hypothetical protein
VKKLESAIFNRPDGMEFILATYATDTGFCTEWSCSQCSATHRCEICLPNADAAFRVAVAEVAAHRCTG